VIDQSNEKCDDGNTSNGDGCAQDCTLEPLAIALETTPNIGKYPLNVTADIDGTSPRAIIQYLDFEYDL